jgi:hypothetical protein
MKRVFVLVSPSGELSLWVQSNGEYVPVEGSFEEDGRYYILGSWEE